MVHSLISMSSSSAGPTVLASLAGDSWGGGGGGGGGAFIRHGAFIRGEHLIYNLCTSRGVLIRYEAFI